MVGVMGVYNFNVKKSCVRFLLYFAFYVKDLTV